MNILKINRYAEIFSRRLILSKMSTTIQLQATEIIAELICIIIRAESKSKQFFILMGIRLFNYGQYRLHKFH